MFHATQMGLAELPGPRRSKLCGLTLVAVALAAGVAQAEVQNNPNRAPPGSQPSQAPGAAPVSPAAAKLVVQAAQFIKERKYDEALPLLDKALAIDPKLVPALKLRALVRMHKNQQTQAMADISELIKLTPKDASLYVTRGTLQAVAKHFDPALADFDRAAALDTKKTGLPMVGRGLVFRLKGERDKALAEYNRALEVNPKQAEAHLGLGIIYRSQGQTDKALAAYDRALAISPKLAEALAERGWALLAKGRATEATTDFDRALENSPNMLLATLGRGMAMWATGQTERAIVAYDQVIDRGVKDAFPYYLRGKALLAKGETDRAMADFNQALKLKPKYTEALAARGMSWSKKKEYVAALADLDEAIAQEERVESYYARAQVYETQGNADRAVADFRKATELSPKSLFDVAAQASAKKRIEQLGKRLPCGPGGGGNSTDTCL